MKRLALTPFFLLGLLLSDGKADEPALDGPELTKNGSYQIFGNWLELKRGWNTLKLKITTPKNEPVEKADVTIVYDMVNMPMDPPYKPVVEKGDGIYEKSIFLGMRGQWQFDTTINKDQTEDIHTKIQDVQK